MLSQPLLKKRKRRQCFLKLLVVFAGLAIAGGGGYLMWHFLRKTHPSPPVTNEQFQFVAQMGSDVSLFVREYAPGQSTSGPPVSTQLRLRPGLLPTITFAWPAENTGVCLLFNATSNGNTQSVGLNFSTLSSSSSSSSIAHNNSAFGLRATVVATLPPSLPALLLEGVVLGSMRAVRDARSHAPSNWTRFEATLKEEDGNQTLVAERWSIDNVAQYFLRLRVNPPGSVKLEEEGWTLVPGHPNGTVSFELEATSTEELMTPLPTSEILSSDALQASTERNRNQLSFLVYKEALLAGADNYLTMFGRDNQFVLAIGASDFLPRTFEVVFASHLEAMRNDGNLMHEPSVGEWASVTNEEMGLGDTRIPTPYDYKMIDTRFLLAMNMLEYTKKVGAETARKFLHSGNTSHGLSFHDALLVNLEFVRASATPFSDNPVWNNLVRIEHPTVGNWRDSNEGLGNGKYPFDVNAVLVPAALHAIVQLAELFGDDPSLNQLAESCKPMAGKWEQAYELFQVTVPETNAKSQALAYGNNLGYNYTGPLPNGTLNFSAVSLDENGQPVAILNSDGGFLLLYNQNATEQQILQVLRGAMSPFPYGLFSPIGMFVSNAAFANESLIPEPWDFHGYHMIVVWPWQEFLLAQGIANQLARVDLTPTAREALEKAELELWTMLYATIDYVSVELYSASVHQNQLKPSAFGEGAGDQTIASVIQLWSQLPLVVRPSPRVTKVLGPLDWAAVKAPQFWPSS